MHFNKNYFGLTLLIFIVEVLIALFVHDGFVRPYVGDVLVVILIYCFVRTFLPSPVFSSAVMVLAFAFMVEWLQYIRIVERIGWHKSAIARTVIGTSFAWADLIAYVVGILIVLFVEKYRLRQSWKQMIVYER